MAVIDRLTASIEQAREWMSDHARERSSRKQHEGELAALADHETEPNRGLVSQSPTNARVDRG